MGKGRPPTAKGARHEAVGRAIWKSDEVVVVEKRANKVGRPTAEHVERRDSARRNPDGRAEVVTQRPTGSDVGLIQVREAAARNRSLRFNNLLHHLSLPLLDRAYWVLRRDSAAGVDGQDWLAFWVGLQDRLMQLHQAVQSGRYGAQPVRRRWIPKADGRLRPARQQAHPDRRRGPHHALGG